MGSNDRETDYAHFEPAEKTVDMPGPRSNRDKQSHVATSDEIEIFDIEDLPTDVCGHLLSVQTVKPYAIEEPDDDTASESQESSLPHQRQNGLWEDLVGSMQDLYCDSDTNKPEIVYTPRGRKRRPSNMASSFSQSSQTRFSTSGRDTQYERPSLNPKRRRRRGKAPIQNDEDLGGIHEQRIHGPKEGGGSSSEALSTDTGGTKFASGCTTADEMDID
ncbi:hypothetical protein BJX64DRAFT_132400 [Aspergillus heterothallicus]